MTKEEFGKLKVGDKVRIVSEPTGVHWAGSMDKWLGKTMTICKINLKTWCLSMEEDKNDCLYGWCWFPEMIECKVESPLVEVKLFYNKSKGTFVWKSSNGDVVEPKTKLEDQVQAKAEDKDTVKDGDYIQFKTKEELQKEFGDKYFDHFTIDVLISQVLADHYFGKVWKVEKACENWTICVNGWHFSKDCYTKYTGKVWKFTKEEERLLSMFKDNYKYIARDVDGMLYAYTIKPRKTDCNSWTDAPVNYRTLTKYIPAELFDLKFDCVTSEDEEPCEFRKFIHGDLDEY